MKTGLFLSIIFAAFLCSVSCTREMRSAPYAWDMPQDTLSAPQPKPVLVKTYTIERATADYNRKAGTGAYIRIRYDWVEHPTQAINDSVNRTILTFIRETLALKNTNAEYSTPQQIADAFIEAYLSQQKSQDWDYQVECRIRNPYPGVFAVECNEGKYTGGAHPDYSSVYQDYVVQRTVPRGKEYLFSNPDAIQGIAEKVSEKEKHLSVSQKSASDDRFTFRNDSVIFLFHNFATAPYILGTSEINFSAENVKNFFQPAV